MSEHRLVGIVAVSAAALAAAALVGCASAAPGGAPASPEPASTSASPTQRYLVTLSGEPVAAYRGSTEGAGGSSPAPGRPFDPNTEAARQREAVLTRQQDAVAAELGIRIVTRYTHTLNGFAADLTSEQADRLAARDDVLAVEPDRIVPLENASPSVLDGS